MRVDEWKKNKSNLDGYNWSVKVTNKKLLYNKKVLLLYNSSKAKGIVQKSFVRNVY